MTTAGNVYPDDGWDWITEPTVFYPRKDGCTACNDARVVRAHGAEDYGVSFESEDCEACAARAVPLSSIPSQFTPDELKLIAEGIGGYLDTAGGLIADTTAEVFRQLRTKAASLAFMEVSRDA